MLVIPSEVRICSMRPPVNKVTEELRNPHVVCHPERSDCEAVRSLPVRIPFGQQPATLHLE